VRKVISRSNFDLQTRVAYSWSESAALLCDDRSGRSPRQKTAVFYSSRPNPMVSHHRNSLKGSRICRSSGNAAATITRTSCPRLEGTTIQFRLAGGCGLPLHLQPRRSGWGLLSYCCALVCRCSLREASAISASCSDALAGSPVHDKQIELVVHLADQADDRHRRTCGCSMKSRTNSRQLEGSEPAHQVGMFLGPA